MSLWKMRGIVDAEVSALGLLVDHSARRCGAVGDAIVETQIITSGTRPHLLVQRRTGDQVQWPSSRQVFSFPRSRHQINLEDCQSGTGLVICARMLLTDLFQSFGVPEVPQITAAGEIRQPYFRNDRWQQIAQWGAANGVPVVVTTVDEEL